MAVYAPSWPLVCQDSMTSSSNDLSNIECANEQRQHSNSNDHEWAKFLAELNNHDQDASSSTGIDLGNLDLNDSPPTHFGGMENMQNMMHTDPLVSTATSSAASVLDSTSNTATHQYMNWPSMEYAGFDTASTSWMPAQQQQQQQHHHHQPQQHHQQQQSQPQQQFDQNSHLMQGRDGLGIQLQMAPTSHPNYHPEPLIYDQPFLSQESSLDYDEDYRQDLIWDRQEQSLPPQDDIFADEDEAEPEDSADPCYAQLLHRCLKEAPGHTMSLRDLYEWVRQHSQKAKDHQNRGWQNSVRHNLSMNAAFQRVPPSPTSPKKGSLWRLTDEALRMGVISTTRYRKDPKRKSDRRSTTPALNRQASGARGGRATRDATRLRQQHRNGGSTALNRFRRSERSHISRFSPYSSSPSPGMPPSSPLASSPYFLELDGDDPSAYSLPLSNCQTPAPQVPMPMYSEQKPTLQNLDYLPVEPMDYAQGGIHNGLEFEMMQQQYNHHFPCTPTPSQASYMTESSYMTDDAVPPLMMSANSHNNSRENTTFQ
ncbi:uncharacterized protein RCC_08096 [Ramularia collo-cygni]|uniref:Fork-head domain-containing protein n=1 Tax=Ramularia collo-cygni TaxID=112498 RepID=A0A2D3VBN7_9PEZI|nr:uncharacterized protein RCC_08096 [Ramularia collo-cygni]CZT22227.1 uncharacterized protein RCC_08096 [Ramularia collo-cygni]